MTGMSTRIGYPNEHLATSAIEDVTSPLHATGVGLVMKGFDHLELRRPKTVVQDNSRKEVVKNHSKRTLGDFFNSVFTSATDLLKEDEN